MTPYTRKIILDRFLLIPHAIAGIVATFLGPFQFSTRFRQRHLSVHRLMGTVYVISILIAAPSALILGQRGFSFPMRFMGALQPVLWLSCTVLAFITARNRQITVHRQWMIRSYAFTLNFIFSRALNFIPAYFAISEIGLAMTLSPDHFVLLRSRCHLQLARTHAPTCVKRVSASVLLRSCRHPLGCTCQFRQRIA